MCTRWIPSFLRRRFAAPVVAIALLIAGGAALLAQQASTQKPVLPDPQIPPITFKVEVNYVEVDATVTDENGRFVGDLKPDEFQVLEDGKPQRVTNFALINVPIERNDRPLFATRPIEPDVQTNVKSFDGRIYLIVLDDYHTSFMTTPRTRAAAKRFVERVMGDNDLAAVVTTSGQLDAAQEFTANRRLLLAAIDKFSGKGLRSATLNRIDDYNLNRGMGEPPRDIDAFERAHKARTALRTIKQVADFMTGVRGRRKAMVFFSEGVSYDIADVFNNPSASEIREETRDAIAAATRANVAVYSIDPRGLTTVGMDATELATVPVGTDPNLRLGPEGMADELRIAQDSLRVLSEETGGFAALNANDPSATFDRIREDNSTYYVLGYYPTNERRDGRFRKIEVRVNRPGVRVRARRGYVAPQGGKKDAAKALDAKGETSPALRETLSSPLPVSGLRLRASAIPFRAAGKNASVVLVLQADGRDLRFVEKDGRLNGTIEVSVLAIDIEGKVRNGFRQSITMPLKPGSLPVVQAHGVRLISRVELPAGRYQLRIGAIDVPSQRTGSIHYDLEVPDFSSGPLGMSGIALTSTLAGTTATAGGFTDEDLKRALPAPPTLSREFRVGEELALMTEVYDSQPNTPHKVDITTTLRSDDGRELFKLADERSSTELQGSRGGYGYTARVPLAGLSPGLYVLKVSAKSRLGKDVLVEREVQFRVVP